MQRLENELRAALRRRPAPQGFTERLLARIARDTSIRSVHPSVFVTRRIWGLAAAAVMAAAVGVGLYAHQRRIQDRNEVALQRTLTALSIVATHLDRVEERAFSPVRWERLSEQLAGAQPSDTPRPSPATMHSSGGRTRT